MDIQKEREEFEGVFPCSVGTALNEYGHYESKINQQDAMIQNISWVVWQAAKAQAIPEGFVLVPMVPSERMIKAVRQCYEGEAYLPYSLYSEFVNQAIIELLEHRRQHNIFEVGDKVVSDFYQLDCVFLISHVCNDDEFIYSNKVFSLGSVFTTSDKLKGECRFLFNEIRHATDEEIKAGKRLEVK